MMLRRTGGCFDAHQLCAAAVTWSVIAISPRESSARSAMRGNGGTMQEARAPFSP
jgi:hypothetical protein